jgi:hypothetical protein
MNRQIDCVDSVDLSIHYLTFYPLTLLHSMEPPEPFSPSTCETLNGYMYYFCGSRSLGQIFSQNTDTLLFWIEIDSVDRLLYVLH